jgi:type II restriction enzyme
MNIKDLIRLYDDKKKIYGPNTHKYISELFREAKQLHYKDWLKHPTKSGDHEQSWRAFKGTSKN